MVVPLWLSTAKRSWPDSPRRSGASLTLFALPPVPEQPFPAKRTHDSPNPARTPRNSCVAANLKECIMIEVEKPDLGHRRAAIQIVAQLPETQADTLLILEAAREFVLEFLAEDHLEGAGRPLPGLRGEGVVLSLVPPALASATSSASADLSL